jgi:DNA (cytosine-5)-methyltransferase 1
MNRNAPLGVYEFFAGGGMARLGLGDGWDCLFANDFDPVKAAAYRADLAWASSPCQDFSLAGARAGLAGGRSSAFFGFWRLVEALDAEGRAPRAIVIENVVGLLTSNGGKDFEALCAALASRGYRFGALEIDAARFTPQSRPRVFVIASRDDPAPLAGRSAFHTRAIEEAQARLPKALREAWVWWNLPSPPARNTDLSALLEDDAAVAWNPDARTARLVEQMTPLHRSRLETAGRTVGAVYRRTRGGVPRAEIRTDGLAGCLRTARGGSSRQQIVVAEGGEVRSRLLTAREGARLMGLPEGYRLPDGSTNAFHVLGDGVAVPVVRWLAAHLLEPLLRDSVNPLAAE